MPWTAATHKSRRRSCPGRSREIVAMIHSCSSFRIERAGRERRPARELRAREQKQHAEGEHAYADELAGSQRQVPEGDVTARNGVANELDREPRYRLQNQVETDERSRSPRLAPFDRQQNAEDRETVERCIELSRMDRGFRE